MSGNMLHEHYAFRFSKSKHSELHLTCYRSQKL